MGVPFRRRPLHLLTGLGVLLAAWVNPLHLQALTFESSETFTLGPNQVLSNEVWMVTGTLDIQGTTKADLFFLAAEASIGGVLKQDVWGVANTDVLFTGVAEDDIRLVGQKSLVVNGRIKGGFAGFGSTVQLGTNAVVNGSVFITAQNAILEGRVEGPAHISALHSTLNGYFGGNVRLTSEDIAIMPGTVISGDLVYTSTRDLVLDPRVQLEGELVKTGLSGKTPQEKADALAKKLITRAVFAVGALLVGIPLILVLPVFSSAGITLLRNQRGRCLLTGAVLFFAVPLFGVVALLSIIGIPLGLILAGGYLVLLYLGKILVAIAIGSLVVKVGGGRFSHLQLVIALSLGLLIIYVITALPVVGTAAWMLISFAGLGASSLSILFSQRGWSVSLPSDKPETGAEEQDSGKVEEMSNDQETEEPKEE